MHGGGQLGRAGVSTGLAQGVVAQCLQDMLIGRGGFTAGAIRSVLNAAAERKGIKVTLRIHSVEEEQQRVAEMEAREIIDDDKD